MIEINCEHSDGLAAGPWLRDGSAALHPAVVQAWTRVLPPCPAVVGSQAITATVLA